MRDTNTDRRTWREALEKERFLPLPVAHNALTARLIERAGFPAADGPAPGDGLGDQLLELAARARAAGLDPETELRAAARRLAARVRDWELRQA